MEVTKRFGDQKFRKSAEQKESPHSFAMGCALFKPMYFNRILKTKIID